MRLILSFLVFICLSLASSKINEELGEIQFKDNVRVLVNSDESTANLRGSEDLVKIDLKESLRGDVKTIGIMKDGAEVEEFDNFARTATGGIVNTIMVALTVFAFLGNGAFMVYVFWLSK